MLDEFDVLVFGLQLVIANKAKIRRDIATSVRGRMFAGLSPFDLKTDGVYRKAYFEARCL